MCGVQGPLAASFYTSQTDRVLPFCCSLLQYADDLAVYVSHVDVENVQRTVQSDCDSLNGFFRDIEVSVSESKTEVVLFSRKHSNPSVRVTLNGHGMPVVPKFRHFGVLFDGKLLWGAHVHYF
jgi:hypothetical protein